MMEVYPQTHSNMKPEARIERECWIISQLFEGYGGYIYEIANRWSFTILFCFAFKGDKFPVDENVIEVVLNMNDGIDWLKNR